MKLFFKTEPKVKQGFTYYWGWGYSVQNGGILTLNLFLHCESSG